MTSLVDDGPGTRTGLNPLTKVATALAVALTAIPVQRWEVLVALLALEMLALPMARRGMATTMRRLAVVAAFACSVTLLNAIGSSRPGPVAFDLLWWTVSEPSLHAAAVAGLRAAVVVLPGPFIMATLDPTDLADALSQRLRLPARFVLGSLAAMSLVPALSEDWRTLARARRARGLDTGSRLARMRAFPSQVFGLLVAALRHGVRMSRALESRGVGSSLVRTHVRESSMGRNDALVLAAVVVVAGLAVALGAA